jgi:hypothetical protein
MRPFRALTTSLAAAALLGSVHAQPSPQPPVGKPHALDLPKVLAHSLSENDVETLMSAFRDALQGRPVDEAKLAPLRSKLEGVVGTVLRDAVTHSIVATERLEQTLKQELRRLQEQNPR